MSVSIRFSTMSPAEQFEHIASNPEIKRTGFRATLGQTCLGLLILEIFKLCCCCFRSLCHDPVENELKSYRVILLQNRRYEGDEDYHIWVRAVERVNSFTLFNRIDTILTRNVRGNHQSSYSPGHHTTILNTNTSYVPSSTYSQRQHTTNSVPSTLQLNTSPTFNSTSTHTYSAPPSRTNLYSMPSGHDRPPSVYINNNSTFSGSTLGHNRPNSVFSSTGSTFQAPSIPSGNNRPGSVPPGTRRP